MLASGWGENKMVKEETQRILLKSIEKVELEYSLRSFNPLKVGGVSDYFTIAHNTLELVTAVRAATGAEVPYIVIGQGRGTIFGDGGFPGLVIQNQANSFAMASDHSQVVSDSGLSLATFIARSAELGLGGLTHLYGQPGSVGGAVYCNLGLEYKGILSNLRYLTVLLPPAKLNKEIRIMRYRGEWLKKSEAGTHLQQLKMSKGIFEPQPVILTLNFQLTSVRSDELQAQMKEQSVQSAPPEGLGPLFSDPTGERAEKLIQESGASSLQLHNLYLDRYHPNYLLSRGQTSAEEIKQILELIAGRVLETYSVRLVPNFEYLGVWPRDEANVLS
jgi:UDP-N-acetylenolpyruvoylglucosamine reductase